VPRGGTKQYWVVDDAARSVAFGLRTAKGAAGPAVVGVGWRSGLVVRPRLATASNLVSQLALSDDPRQPAALHHGSCPELLQR